ncbi:MAG: efflux RND transporter periplasmic adaptor subunit [Pirellulales bacterium]
MSNDLLVSLSSSGQSAPNYWLDPKTGVQYPLAVQTPQYKIGSVEAITNTPVALNDGKSEPQLLGNLAKVRHDVGPTNVTHYNIAQSFDLLAGVEGTDLGTVSAGIDRIVDEIRSTLPRGTTISVRGQVESMNGSFRGLAFGLVFAVVLVYLLMTVNFQSWTDPAIILMALPGAVCGIAWMLFVTRTTINVPSLMGAMMCVGVATANSILLVTFANDLRKEGKTALDAAWIAGVTRLRPVVMTALAMILGMLPMSLGLGEGGEQNCAARSRRDRRPGHGDVRHAVLGADRLQLDSCEIPPTVGSRRAGGIRTLSLRGWFMSLQLTGDAVSEHALANSSDTSTTHTASVPAHATDHDEIGERPAALRLGGSRAVLVVGGLLGAIALFFAIGKIPRHLQATALTEETERLQSTPPRVNVTLPKQSPKTQIALLPGEVQAMEETVIYPRTAGYLKKWYVDIGDNVKAGQLLAEIDAPEVAQQLSHTEAMLLQLKAKAATAASTLKLADITLTRNKSILPGAISKQELDENQTTFDSAKAAVQAADADVAAGEAEVRRYRELDSFSRILAPFPGTITARDIDVGQLVTPGNGAGQSLFRLARTNPVRVFVNVPQIDASGVELDMSAKIFVRELPNRSFVGKVTRTARAIDPTTRTLRTEIQVPNEDHALLVGSYVQVELEIVRPNPPLLIPSSSLVFNADGMRVAIIDRDDKVHFVDVDVLGDYGTSLGIAKGLSPTDRVVTNPGDRLAEGVTVRVDAAQTQPANAKSSSK